MGTVEQGRELLRRTAGTAMVVAPVLLLVSTIAYATGGGINHDETGGFLQLLAMTAFVPAIWGLVHLASMRFPRTAVALVVVGALGIIGGTGYGIDGMHVANGAESAEQFGLGPLALNLPGAMFPLTFLIAGVTLWRGATDRRWTGAVLMLAAVAFPASRIPAIEPLAVVADALFLVSLVPVGLSLLNPSPATERLGGGRTVVGEPGRV